MKTLTYIKKLIPKTLFAKISVVLIILGISLPFFNDSVFPHYVKRCGVITQKMAISRGSSGVDLVFGMQFPSQFKAVDVTKTTYMQYHVGDNVCFTMKQDVSFKVKLMRLYGVMALIGFFVYVVFSLVNDDDDYFI